MYARSGGLDGMKFTTCTPTSIPRFAKRTSGSTDWRHLQGLRRGSKARPVADGGPEPDLALLGFLEDNSKERDHYDALLGAGYRPFPTFRIGHPRKHIQVRHGRRRRAIPYRRLMRWFANYLFVPARSSAAAKRSVDGDSKRPRLFRV